MPNHFHLVVRPHATGDLSRWMQWLMTTHVRRYLRHYQHTGHVWQGRFKAFPIQDDDHLITVVRYVERNPPRRRYGEPCGRLRGPALVPPHAAPEIATDELLRRGDWTEFVNAPQTEAEVQALRLSIHRNRPFGSDTWTHATAEQLGLQSSIRRHPARNHATVLYLPKTPSLLAA